MLREMLLPIIIVLIFNKKQKTKNKKQKIKNNLKIMYKIKYIIKINETSKLLLSYMPPIK
jgi:hypothetical protein